MYFTTRKLIMKTERDTQINFSQIFGELPKKVVDGVEMEVGLDDVQIDDILVIHAGEMIAVDGVILSGHGVIELSPTLRADTQQAIKILQEQGKTQVTKKRQLPTLLVHWELSIILLKHYLKTKPISLKVYKIKATKCHIS
jgi:cation transport ATPase